MNDTLQDTPAAVVEEEAKVETPVSADTLEDRLVAVGEWLVHGTKRAEAVRKAMTEFGVGRRAAQRYVHDAMVHMMRDAAEEHRLFQLRVSQRQRDELVVMAMNAVEQARNQLQLDQARNQLQLDPRGLAALVNAANKALDGRDRAAAEIHKLMGYTEPVPRNRQAQHPAPDAPQAFAAQDSQVKDAAPQAQDVARQYCASPQAPVPQGHPDSTIPKDIARPGAQNPARPDIAPRAPNAPSPAGPGARDWIAEAERLRRTYPLEEMERALRAGH